MEKGRKQLPLLNPPALILISVTSSILISAITTMDPVSRFIRPLTPPPLRLADLDRKSDLLDSQSIR